MAARSIYCFLASVNTSLSGTYKGKKAVDTCRCYWQWQFEKMGIFLLKLHRSVKMPRVNEP